MATLANFRTRIAAELGLDNTASSADQVEIDARVNEGVVDFVLRTGCKVSSATMTSSAGTGDYTLDTAVLQVRAWSWSSGGLVTRPRRVSLDEILDLRRSTTSGTVAAAYAVEGSNLLLIWPATGETITVYYVPRPATLANSSDTPSEIPAEFHPAVEAYALWKLASMRDDQSSGQGRRYKEDYDEMVARYRKMVNKKGGRLAPFRMPGKRLSGVPTVPSQDVG